MTEATDWKDVFTPIASWTAAVVFFVLLAWYLIRFFTEAEGKSPLGRRNPQPEHASWKKILINVALAFVISRVLLYLGGALGAWLDDSLIYYLKDPLRFWTRWDGDHYVGLIKNWYVTEGDPRYHIVFFPLYPAICRIIHLATGIDAEITGYIVSNLAFLGCGVLMFRLAEMEYGISGGVRAAWLFMLSPLTLFCSLPYTESIFLLTTLGAVVAARKQKFVLAVALGALSANTRMVGMATAVPIFYEMLRAWDGMGRPKKYVRAALCVLPVSLGLIAYIALNYAVTGDPFKFLQYQSEHWSQNFGSLYNTVTYTSENAIEYGVKSYKLGVWGPQLITIFAALALFAVVIRSAHPGDMGYALIYFYFSVAPTWLLSGPRYLTAMYPSYPLMAMFTKNKFAFIALAAIAGGLCVFGGYLFAWCGCIL